MPARAGTQSSWREANSPGVFCDGRRSTRHRRDFEVVLLLPTGCGGVWISNANHRTFHRVPVLHQFHVIVVGEGGVLVKVLSGPLYGAWLGASAAGHHVNDAILKEALVIVDVPGDDHETYPRL